MFEDYAYRSRSAPTCVGAGQHQPGTGRARASETRCTAWAVHDSACVNKKPPGGWPRGSSVQVNVQTNPKAAGR